MTGRTAITASRSTIEGNVWLAGNGDKDTQLLKFDGAGKFLLQIGKHGVHNGSNDIGNFWKPTKVFVDAAANEVYVARRLRQPPGDCVRRDVGQIQEALGRVRQPAQRRSRSRLQSDWSALEAIQHRALRDGVERWIRLRLRSRQRSHSGVSQGRHVRQGSRRRRPHVSLRIVVGHDVLARPTADVYLRRQRRRSEDQHPAAQHSRGADVVRRRRPRRLDSSSASTTLRPTHMGISTRPKPTRVRACSDSSTRGSGP